MEGCAHVRTWKELSPLQAPLTDIRTRATDNVVATHLFIATLVGKLPPSTRKKIITPSTTRGKGS